MPNKIYDEEDYHAKVRITQTGNGWVAELLIDKKCIHKTAPMFAKANAIMLINRKIKRFNLNKRSIDRIPPYKE